MSLTQILIENSTVSNLKPLEMGKSKQRLLRLIELNKDIHNSSKQIAKTQENLKILGTLIEEFSKLVFDKLALDAVHQKDFDSEVDSHAIRVILGRIKAAMVFFTDCSAPVSDLSKHESSPLKIGIDINLESHYSLYISRRNAEKRLCKLTDKLVELQRKTDGLNSIMRRFEEDNNALRSDIQALRQTCTINYDANFGQHTWTRLAGVDLMSTSEKRQSICSQRRMSALSSRRMSFTSNGITLPVASHPRSTNTHPTGIFDSTQFQQKYCPSPTSIPSQYFPDSYTSRPLSMHANMDHRLSSIGTRRSGALSDTDSMGRDDSMSSTSTSISSTSNSKFPTQTGYPLKSNMPNRWSRSAELASYL